MPAKMLQTELKQLNESLSKYETAYFDLISSMKNCADHSDASLKHSEFLTSSVSTLRTEVSEVRKQLFEVMKTTKL